MEVNMNKVDPKNLKSCWFDIHLNPDNSEWLGQNSKEMDQSVKQIMKLMEDNFEDVTKSYEMDSLIKSEVIVQVHELYRLYQSLADRYDNLIGELRKSVNQKSVQQASSFSSEMSLKEGTESSSFSSDSDSDSFSSSEQTELPSMNKMMQVVDGDNADDTLKMEGNRSYVELSERLAKCKEELSDSNLKLQHAEEEIVRLNVELKKSESFAILAENMIVHLESMQRDMKTTEGDLELAKEKVHELEANVSDSNSEVMRLMEELAVSKEKIASSEDEIAMFKHEYGKKICDDTHRVLSQLESAQEDIAILKAQLDIERRQVVNLQEQILSYRKDRGREVKELKGALCDAQDNVSMQKASFQSEIFGLLENETLLEAKLKEWEVYGRDLEAKIRQSETEKMEIKDSYDVQENTLQGQISQLRVELNEKGDHVEALNKNLDKMKFKYDMLMADKDGVVAKVNTLVAEARSRDLQIGQMEEHLHQLISGSKQAKNLEEELKLKINELEKEVDRQRIVIFDVAEEKREVIRQLSFTLEHYRSGYKECQAFLKHKRHAVMV